MNGALTQEQQEILKLFTEMLALATADGAKKREAGTKVSWKVDPEHEAGLWSHINEWKHGRMRDKDSGADPRVHAAWRLLALAAQDAHPEWFLKQVTLAERAYEKWQAVRRAGNRFVD